MDAEPTLIPAQGLLDQARAEVLATRVRAAVRNGRRTLRLRFAPDCVLASAGLAAFLHRTAAVLDAEGGRLELAGEPALLATLGALGLADRCLPATTGGGR